MPTAFFNYLKSEPPRQYRRDETPNWEKTVDTFHDEQYARQVAVRQQLQDDAADRIAEGITPDALETDGYSPDVIAEAQLVLRDRGNYPVRLETAEQVQAALLEAVKWSWPQVAAAATDAGCPFRGDA